MRVIVVGGGWAGYAAALSAKKRGAEVVLLERTDILLGTGLVGGIMRNNGRYTATEELIAMGGGAIFSIRDPEQKLSFPELAKRVYFTPGPRSLSMDMKMGNDFLPDVQATWFSPNTARNPTSIYTTFCLAADVAVVEVDVETGAVKLLKMTHVHDAGNIISRELVEGQIHGGVAQGLGEALFEEIIYGDDGDMLTESYTNYLLPTALDIPEMTIGHMQTPSPYTELGTKGMGEAPLISSKAALIAAVEDDKRQSI
jgi:carbon-monoxide dehydrogenase large subunit